jgi:hypothetical protein
LITSASPGNIRSLPGSCTLTERRVTPEAVTVDGCCAGATWRPVRCALSRLGRRSRDEKPGRYSERSAPGMGSATPRCIRMRNQAE